MHTRDLDLFGGLDVAERLTRRQRRALAPVGTTLDLADGTVIEREGRECRQLFVLVRGVAAVTVDGELQEMLRRGDAWGDAGLSGAVARRSAVATGPVRIHVYDTREFRTLRTIEPALAARLLRTGTATAGLEEPRRQVSLPSRCEQAGSHSYAASAL